MSMKHIRAVIYIVIFVKPIIYVWEKKKQEIMSGKLSRQMDMHIVQCLWYDPVNMTHSELFVCCRLAN